MKRRGRVGSDEGRRPVGMGVGRERKEQLAQAEQDRGDSKNTRDD